MRTAFLLLSVGSMFVCLATLSSSAAAAEPGSKAQVKKLPDSQEPRDASVQKAKPGESTVRAAGTEPPDVPVSAAKPVKEAESAEGVKTYEFGAVEVEGRLRSPQILYFLRRVRAEFDAASLGHRSFLRELADTRNDRAFR